MTVLQQSVTLHRGQLLSITGVVFPAGTHIGGSETGNAMSHRLICLYYLFLSISELSKKYAQKGMDIKYEVRTDMEQQRQAGRAWLGGQHPETMSPVSGRWLETE